MAVIAAVSSKSFPDLNENTIQVHMFPEWVIIVSKKIHLTAQASFLLPNMARHLCQNYFFIGYTFLISFADQIYQPVIDQLKYYYSVLIFYQTRKIDQPAYHQLVICLVNSV